jgi:hypothetical protein
VEGYPLFFPVPRSALLIHLFVDLRGGVAGDSAQRGRMTDD